MVTVVLFIKGIVVIFVSLRQLSRLKSDVAGRLPLEESGSGDFQPEKGLYAQVEGLIWVFYCE